MIPMEFTHGIQWKGRGIHQAGGVCAVLSYDDYTYGETQGWIQTPYTDVRLDDGNFILRFRARSIAQTKDSLILYLQDQYSNNYYTSEKRTITDQWQTIEVSFQHNFGMGSRLAYVQIGAYNDSWLIDDIEIIQDVYDILCNIYTLCFLFIGIIISRRKIRGCRPHGIPSSGKMLECHIFG